ncbi:MAG TPA: enoyl-CoA hydratase/isomerase family protein [Candidatus Sulfotelmatobacter sp.]|nr:enoyl-CoA hydratase/isomerase family protein [Candidatus Sulfotelmatobacter sp.]
MPVLYEKRNHVGYLTFSRPDARNCWGDDYNEELPAHCETITFDDDVHAVVLTGDERGGAFSAGANIRDPRTHVEESAGLAILELPKRRRYAGHALIDLPKPVIAAVNGYAVGIGAITTLCCDMIVASERAEWRLPQVALGIMPNHAGAVRVAQWIGKGNAMKLAMGWPLKADEAYRLGLAQWLVPHAELMDQATAIAERLAGLPPLASRLTKESLNRGMDMPSLADAAYLDLYRQALLSMTADAKESHQAWRDKRKPEFKGA